jgi:hypothetical protein
MPQADNRVMGRVLTGVGLVRVTAGLLGIGLERMGVGLGRLPGDFVWQRKSTTVYAPLGTCLLLSMLLLLVLYVVSRMRR